MSSIGDETANPTLSSSSLDSEENSSKHEKSPYADGTLSVTGRSDLAVLVHFLLLFRRLLNLSAYELLETRPERSLISQSGHVYTSLVLFLATNRKRSYDALETKLDSLVSVGAKLAYLCDLVDKAMGSTELRAATMTEDGRVAGAARLRTNMRDGNGHGYVWLRGLDGCCSDRILRRRSGVEDVMRREESLEVVRRLEKGDKKDFVAAGWLKERVDRATVRAQRETEAEEQNAREEAEKRLREKERQMERVRKLARLRKNVGEERKDLGRGRRERKLVSYVEGSGDEGEGVDDGDDFVLSDQEEERAEDSGEEEEAWEEDDGEVVAVGRVRVYSSGRTTRNSRRAAKETLGRPVRKCRRLLRSNVE